MIQYISQTYISITYFCVSEIFYIFRRCFPSWGKKKHQHFEFKGAAALDKKIWALCFKAEMKPECFGLWWKAIWNSSFSCIMHILIQISYTYHCHKGQFCVIVKNTQWTKMIIAVWRNNSYDMLPTDVYVLMSPSVSMPISHCNL